jgi:prepilin-type processing-associated H-X9-DG protein/prepilin-type N-terminal cleavage/methylation domain-containing protein
MLRQFLRMPLLPDFLATNASKYNVQREPESIDGTAYWIIEWPGMDKIWVDAAHGYAVRRRIFHWTPGGPLARQIDNSDFREIKPGLWFCFVQVVESYADPDFESKSLWGKANNRATYTVSDIDLSHAPDGLTAVRLPVGTMVKDEVRKIEYTVTDDEGDPFKRPLGQAAEVASRTRVGLPLFLGVAAVLPIIAILYYLVRRRKRGATLLLLISLIPEAGAEAQDRALPLGTRDERPLVDDKGDWSWKPAWLEKNACGPNSLFVLLRLLGKDTTRESFAWNPEKGILSEYSGYILVPRRAPIARPSVLLVLGLSILSGAVLAKAWRRCLIAGRACLASTIKHGTGREGHPPNRRGAMTLMEVLVAISIIGMLMALLLPAVQQVREAGRRAQCANNLRNVGLSVQGEMNAKRRLPASGNFSTTGVRFHDWVVNVLPYIERSDIVAQWRFDQPSNTPPNAALATVHIDVLVCPDDDTSTRGQGNLSYVVNGGFGFTMPVDCPSIMHAAGGAPQFSQFDFNGNGVTCPPTAAQDSSPLGGDKDLLFKTSLFFPENWPHGTGTQRHHTAESVLDGLSHTIMLAENLWAGYDPAGGDWANPYPWRTSFFLSGYVCQNNQCSAGNVDWSRANSRVSPYSAEAINGGLSAAEGASPWPSSRHPSGVNVVFCDGHLRFLNENIDGALYAWLVTPQGDSIRGPLAQPPMDDSQ